MSGSCASLVNDGVIRGVLGAVDCQTRAFAEAGYSSAGGLLQLPGRAHERC